MVNSEFTEAELPLVRQYVNSHNNPSESTHRGSREPKSKVQEFLDSMNYTMFLPKFINNKNKYVFYVLALLCFGILGMVLKNYFELDFSEMTDYTDHPKIEGNQNI